MGAVVDGFQLAWTLGIRRLRVQSDSMAVIFIFFKILLLFIIMLPMLCSSRSYIVANGKFIFLIFTVKLIIL
ncbi:hypothetical protein LINGRAHAP2_LOCUS8126 [Linum grandiflorum]